MAHRLGRHLVTLHFSSSRGLREIVARIAFVSGAAVTAGATLKSDASGRAITWATSGAKVGIALEAATASGQMIEVLLIPNVA